jgi:anti-sigma factor RsiW
MLPADQLELMTAAVDGELSATEAAALRRLLAGSPQARALFAKLKADSERVRALPRTAPPADLQKKILARLATAPARPLATPAKPRQPEPRPTRRGVPAWVPVAAAASVLLCVTAGSFAFFNAQTKAPTAKAKNSWSDVLPAAQESSPAVPSPTASAPQQGARPNADAAVLLNVSPVPPLPPPRPVTPETIVAAPPPRSTQPDLIGSAILDPPQPLDFVQAWVPFLRMVADLDRDDIRQELIDELRHGEPAFRLDLFVRDTARGAEVFQNAAKAAGLTVFADATTLERLKKKQIASVVIYTESLTATELSALFAKLCAEDMKFSPRVCDSLHATPAVRADEIELKSILGTDVGLFKRALGASGSVGTGQGERGDKPVSAATIDSVSKSLTTPAPKAGEQFAVLMTWQTTHPMLARTSPTASAELKKYLEKRGPRKPNAVPAVIVIRPVG